MNNYLNKRIEYNFRLIFEWCRSIIIDERLFVYKGWTMKKYLITGAGGLVGKSTALAFVKNYCTNKSEDNSKIDAVSLTLFDVQTKTTQASLLQISRELKNHSIDCKIVFGDIRKKEDIEHLIHESSAVIHLAAIIPPVADEKPLLAYSVNVEGTKNIVDCIKTSKQKTALIFSSSIATYGDRVKENLIRLTDEQKPNDDDEYAKHKVACEAYIRASGIDFCILRLSYIVSPKKLFLHPIMFKMPLQTSIEICSSADTALACANAARLISSNDLEEKNSVNGKTFLIAGGKNCRTTYKDYLNSMLKLFGFSGASWIPPESFSKKGYHCAFMETEESENVLKFQNHNLNDYYNEVKAHTKMRRFLVRVFKPIAKAVVLALALKINS